MESLQKRKKFHFKRVLSKIHNRSAVSSISIIQRDIWTTSKFDWRIFIWDSETFRIKQTLDPYSNTRKGKSPIYSLVKVDHTVWAISQEGTIFLWKFDQTKQRHLLIDTIEELYHFHPHSMYSPLLMYSPHTSLVFVAFGHTIFVFDKQGSRRPELALVSPFEIITCSSVLEHENLTIWVAVENSNPNAKEYRNFLYSFSYCTLQGLCLQTSLGCESPVLSLTSSPTPSTPTVWSGHADGSLYIWQSGHAAPIFFVRHAHQSGLSCIQHSHQLSHHEMWSVGGDSCLRVWDSSTFQCTQDIRIATSRRLISLAMTETKKKIVVYTGDAFGNVYTSSLPCIGCCPPETKIMFSELGDKYVGTVCAKKKLEVAEHEITSPQDDEIPGNGYLKHGLGELHTHQADPIARYAGYWDMNEKSGFGIASYRNHDKYYGSWLHDKLHGFGCYIHADGTVFLGSFSEGKRRGPGKLVLPNGDSFTGIFIGRSLEKCIYTKSGEKFRISQSLFYLQSLGKIREKVAFPLHNQPLSHERYIVNKWNMLLYPSHGSFDLNSATPKSSSSPLRFSTTLAQRYYKKYPTHAIDNKLVTIILNDESLPIGEKTSAFIFFFMAGYHHSYGSVQRQVQHALDDIYSFSLGLTTFFCEIFTLKGEPAFHYLLLLKHIRQFLLNAVFEHLMSLYSILYHNLDSLFAAKLSMLGHKSLFVGINEKFLLGYSVSEEFPAKKLYATAIKRLQEITLHRYIERKNECLLSVFTAIYDEITSFYTLQGLEAPSLGADDIYPILAYVVMEAKVPTLYSELAYVSEFMERNPSPKTLEIDFRLLELQYTMKYVNKLQLDLLENNTFIPLRVLKDRLKTLMNSTQQTFVKRHHISPHFLFLSEILLFFGTTNIAEKVTLPVNSSTEQKYSFLHMLQDVEYLHLANEILNPFGLFCKLIKDKNSSQVSLWSSHMFPLPIYRKLANYVIRKKKWNNTSIKSLLL